MVKPKKDNVILEIAVYYECLCPDSRSFFVNELLPVVERIPNLLDIDFVPYGKAHVRCQPSFFGTYISIF